MYSRICSYQNKVIYFIQYHNLFYIHFWGTFRLCPGFFGCCFLLFLCLFLCYKQCRTKWLLQISLAIVYKYNCKQLNYYLNECCHVCACWSGGGELCLPFQFFAYNTYFNSFLKICITKSTEKHIKHKCRAKCTMKKKPMSRHLVLLAPQKDLVCPSLIITPKR